MSNNIDSSAFSPSVALPVTPSSGILSSAFLIRMVPSFAVNYSNTFPFSKLFAGVDELVRSFLFVD
jgi:hypothetical protein